MTRTFRILLALDNLFGSFLFKGISADETISAYCSGGADTPGAYS